ncbi:hypothetical protein [Streptomyces ipomoeae]|uniref:hypothetical protein n=1 Tax=Streptomyces ipomoeae TaxID=103232 RepID=UPI001146E53F|nr:hypothetical protein [Streptomyces ipomoeae]TQE33137.1 hypothetical protein Sipo7851_21835 [Streptomyces ipomoeae]
MTIREPLTVGLLRAALEGVAAHTPVQVPIPLSTMDGGPTGHHFADALSIHHIKDDSVQVLYDEPEEWAQQAAAESREFRQSLRIGAAYLTATRPGVRRALEEVIAARLPEHAGDGALVDALAAAIAGATTEYLERTSG